LTFSTTNPLLKAVIGKPNFDYLASVIYILRIAVIMYFFLLLPVHSLMKTPSRQNSSSQGIPQVSRSYPPPGNPLVVHANCRITQGGSE
jgi:hypothetical protein